MRQGGGKALYLLAERFIEIMKKHKEKHTFNWG